MLEINGVEEKRSELSDLRNSLRCQDGLMLDLKSWKGKKRNEQRGDLLLRLHLATVEVEEEGVGEVDEEESLKDLQDLSTLVTLTFLSTRFIDSLLRHYLLLNRRPLQPRNPRLPLPILLTLKLRQQ